MVSTDKLRWTYRRLRAMSAAEALWRSGHWVRAVGDRTAHRFRLLRYPRLETIADPDLDSSGVLFGHGPTSRGFLPDDDREALKRQIASQPPARLAQIGSTWVSRIGGSELVLEPGVDWNRDPESGEVFPRSHRSTIDYRRPEVEAAIRRIWYQNRHFALPELALRYHLDGDRAAAEQATALLERWLDQCPPQSGVNWSVPLEVALRLWSWAWTARLLAGSEQLARLAPRLAVAVHVQAEDVRHHLAAYSSANNHLIAQGLGLLAAGQGFSGLRRAPVWWAAGRAILEREIVAQTFDDGVSREQSRHYHEFVVEIGLAAACLLARAKVAPAPTFRARLERMIEFIADLEALPGGASSFGDSDDQSALPFIGDERPAQNILAIGAVLFGREDWKSLVGAPARAAAILLGKDGRQRFESLRCRARVPDSRLYRQGGYAILRDRAGERSLLVDCGQLGFLGTAAHGHADALSITLAAFDQAMLIDPGTYTYHAEPTWRDFFRSTAAHNTVRIDGREQSEMQGPFLWGRKAAARPLWWCPTDAIDVLEAMHDGYRLAPEGIEHRRRLCFVKPDYIWMRDELLGAGEHEVELFLHFPPCALRLKEREKGQRLGLAVFPSGSGLEILLPGSADGGLMTADILMGLEDPPQGWVSAEFGTKKPAPVLRVRGRTRLPASIDTVLRPLARTESTAAGEVSAEVQDLGGGAVLLMTAGMPGRDACLVGARHDRNQAPSAGPLVASPEYRLRGRTALVRWSADGAPDGQQTEAPRVLAGARVSELTAGDRRWVRVTDGWATFSLQRQGDQAVWSGHGRGRIALWAPDVRAIRCAGRPLDFERDGAYVSFALTPAAAGGGMVANQNGKG